MTVQEQINAARMKLSMAQEKLQRLNEYIDEDRLELPFVCHTLMCNALGNIADAQKVMIESVLDIGQREARPIDFK